jgi:archaellin
MNDKVVKMNNFGSTGITAITLLTSLLTTGAASSIMMQNTDSLSSDALQMVNDVVDEITTYLKIDDILGKYYTENGTRSVERIVILIKQPMKNAINISDVTIKICNNEDVVLLGYSGHAEEYNSNGVFENHVWETTDNTFSLIVIRDKDRSLLDYNIMNDDTAFIAIKLPNQFAMGNDDSLTVSIIPDKGMTHSVVLETPSFHISDIINFGDV